MLGILGFKIFEFACWNWWDSPKTPSLCGAERKGSKLALHPLTRCFKRNGKGLKGNSAMQVAGFHGRLLLHKKKVSPKSSWIRGISRTRHVEFTSKFSGNIWSSTAGTRSVGPEWGTKICPTCLALPMSVLAADVKDSLMCFTTKRCCSCALLASSFTGTSMGDPTFNGVEQAASSEMKNSCASRKEKLGSFKTRDSNSESVGLLLRPSRVRRVTKFTLIWFICIHLSGGVDVGVAAGPQCHVSTYGTSNGVARSTTLDWNEQITLSDGKPWVKKQSSSKPLPPTFNICKDHFVNFNFYKPNSNLKQYPSPCQVSVLLPGDMHQPHVGTAKHESIWMQRQRQTTRRPKPCWLRAHGFQQKKRLQDFKISKTRVATSSFT